MSSAWQETKAPDGKVYYYNDQTKATQWTKPLEMMSAAEVHDPDSSALVLPTDMRGRERCKTSRGKSIRRPMEGLIGMHCSPALVLSSPLLHPIFPALTCQVSFPNPGNNLDDAR